MEPEGAKLCICGHDRTAHEHYRSGSDCSLCPTRSCRKFRSATSLRQGLSRLLGRAGPKGSSTTDEASTDQHPSPGPPSTSQVQDRAGSEAS